jgi:PEP-CTERM motif
MKLLPLLCLVAAAVTNLVPQRAEAATLIVDSGKLVGATGVDVLGTLYDVSFVDGTCAQAYGTCQLSSFAFTSANEALAAAMALDEQVFVDGVQGNFDTLPSLTMGCIVASSSSNCTSFIPFGIGQFGSGLLDSAYVLNKAPTSLGFGVDGDTGTTFTGINTSYLNNNAYTWAKFAPAVASAVPEPATWAMMIVGFGLVGGSMRLRIRRRALSLA